MTITPTISYRTKVGTKYTYRFTTDSKAYAAWAKIKAYYDAGLLQWCEIDTEQGYEGWGETMPD